MAKQTVRGITTPKGFRAAGGSCGIKNSDKPDLALIVADQPCAAAGLFTTNKVPAAAVVMGQRHLRSGTAQAIVCNSGNANAATGSAGNRDAKTMCKWVGQYAKGLNIDPNLVLPNSTGIIGHRLPMEKIKAGIAALMPELARGSRANSKVAEAIMTTDLVAKQACRSVRLGTQRNRTASIGGICKGSGMIAPNMATMLAFVTTDINISPRMLHAALLHATSESFNRISIDQHTSPSDAVLILASAAAGGKKINHANKDFDCFQEALTLLCQDLAHQIVSDGEGATKVIRVRVLRAANAADAERIGKTVVDSPLVKTAVHGGDPNWGRVITAIGYSGAKVKPTKLVLYIGMGSAQTRPAAKPGVCVLAQGEPTRLSATDQRQLTRIMASKEIVFTIDLGLGRASTQWLGCDLSDQYVTINAHYTT